MWIVIFSFLVFLCGDKRIKYFESEGYLNLYQARNEALKYSKGEYVTFLDTDDLWEDNKIEKQL